MCIEGLVFIVSLTIVCALPFQAQIGGNKRQDNSSNFGVRTTRGKTNSVSATRLASGKGARHYSKVLESATTGNRTALKLGLQQFNLQLVNVNQTCMCNQNVNRTSM